MLQHNVLGLYAWRALNTLKSRSLSAEDARITSNLLAQTDNTGIGLFVRPPPMMRIKNNVVLSDPQGKIMIDAVAPRVQTQLV